MKRAITVQDSLCSPEGSKEQLLAPGTAINRTYVRLSNGISLSVTKFIPVTVSRYPPVVMVPGLFSVMENFRHLLPDLTRDFTVYYLETREKNSSICPEHSVFSIENMADDLNEVLKELDLNPAEFLLLGYSMGATVVLEALSAQGRLPAGIILAGPVGSFGFPAWSLWLARVAAPLYRVIKPLLKLYIKYFMVNHREDPEMHHIQTRVLDSADPYKLCATLPELARYNIWDRLPPIACPLLIIGASKDSFHNHNDALRLSEMILNSTYIDFETNLRNHSREVVKTMKEFLHSSLT